MRREKRIFTLVTTLKKTLKELRCRNLSQLESKIAVCFAFVWSYHNIARTICK